MQGDRYSQMVAWLKVMLPLLALGILSTLFLISRAVDPPAVIPFADNEVQERLSNQQVTGPYYSGTSSNGDLVTFIADSVKSPSGQVDTKKATDVHLAVQTPTGPRYAVTAELADVNLAKDLTVLTGRVAVTTSEGFRLYSQLLNVKMSQVDITSPESVSGFTPVGELEAGTMRLFTPDGQSEHLLLFTNGVKLVYRPNDLKD